MKRNSLNIVSLGCSKNLVDSERLMGRLSDAGFAVTFEHTTADRPYPETVVINTCGFIGDAKEESVNTILEWGQLRAAGKIGKLIVMGCLSERYRDELPTQIPEVDRWYGKFDWDAIAADLGHGTPGSTPYNRVITTPSHHAYLKISEGCNRFCAFCAIPLITGRHHSRTPDDIVNEVKKLVGRGVSEFNVIAQDLSAYGTDIPHENGERSPLAELVDRLADIDGVRRIRLHYAYPAGFPLDLLDVMATRPNVCRYLDIALQHASDNMLTAMRRHIDIESTRRLLDEIRKRVPGIHIRTTMMVGFPGETDEDFNRLVDFVKEQRFERLGAFAYCEEEETYAALNLQDDVPQDVKQQRLDTLLDIQQEIAYDHNKSKIGQTLEVVIDREEEDYYIGRSEFDSPEVDPEVLVEKSREMKPGEYIRVTVTDALPFELIAAEAVNI